MNIFPIVKSAVSFTGGIGAGIITSRIIDNVAPAAELTKKWAKVAHYVGRYALVGISIDAATEHLKKEFDKAKDAADGIKEAVEGVQEGLADAKQTPRSAGNATDITKE